MRSAVWDFLQKENVWNDKQLQRYAIRMQYLIENIVKKISNFNIPYEKKIELFNTIESDGYCKKLFAYPIKSYILRLLLAHKYRILLFLLAMRYRVSKVIKRFR